MLRRLSYPSVRPVRFVFAAVALTALLLTTAACEKKEAPDNDVGDSEVYTVSQGESLVIPISEISETVRFYPVSVNGTEMEILAVKDSGGNIRTAFNTCRICYDSGRGYYKQQGNALVCQNCGNRFTAEQIGTETGGCAPYPISDSDKTVTDDSIRISYEFLDASRQIFLNWKSVY